MIVSGKPPVTNAFGQSVDVLVQLCRHCDADTAAGGLLLRFFAEGGGRDRPRAPG
ncbi:hypothetical protein SGFS_031830 [Streptomyces graminofaciens]|uniref:Uncharacterized protein n=1 Tax=Streptomyces graminofaciens TaxID=68212 RepID=A0ABM7F7G2_9ACTN|nr:hypothetical protein SGFS_031830 [Streptomyces graminofaciens]